MHFVNDKCGPPGHPIKIAKNATRYLTTTSTATPRQENPLFQEGMLVLAINAHKHGQFSSFRSAVTIYDVLGWPGGPHGP